MRYTKLNTNFWSDDYISELNDREKIVFLFYFTNERVSMSGIYEIPDKMTAYFLNLDKSEILELKKKFESDRKYFFYKSWVFIPNTHKHNRYSTNKFVVRSYVTEFNKIPSDARKYFLSSLNLEFIPPFDLSKVSYTLSEEKEIVMEIEKEIEREKWEGTRHGLIQSDSNNDMNEDVDPKDIPF